MAKYWRLDTGLCIAVALMAVWASDYHPYSYFQMLRWFACVMAGYVAWRIYQAQRIPLAVLFAAAAILFNPIAPIRFQRGTWATLDLAGAGLFLFAAYLTGSFPPLAGSKRD